MRHILFGALVATVASVPAFGADMAVKAPMLPPVVPAFSWTGTYVGLNLGGVWGSFRDEPTVTAIVTGVPVSILGTNVRNTSWVGGGQAGYNWQVGSWVLGIEQDYQFTNLKSNFVFGVGPGGALVAGDAFSNKVDFLSGTRARLGWAFDRSLFYATGGLEFAALDTSGSFVGRLGGSPALVFSDKNKYHIGWTVGAGYQYAITNNVALGVDYRYFDLGNQTYNVGAITDGRGVTSFVSNRMNLTANEVTLTLNVKLNGLGLFGM